MDANDLRRLKRDYKRLHAACSKITDLYVKAPGGGTVNPIPTIGLVWKMYQAALKGIADAVPPRQI